MPCWSASCFSGSLYSSRSRHAPHPAEIVSERFLPYLPYSPICSGIESASLLSILSSTETRSQSPPRPKQQLRQRRPAIPPVSDFDDFVMTGRGLNLFARDDNGGEELALEAEEADTIYDLYQ